MWSGVEPWTFFLSFFLLVWDYIYIRQVAHTATSTPAYTFNMWKLDCHGATPSGVYSDFKHFSAVLVSWSGKST